MASSFILPAGAQIPEPVGAAPRWPLQQLGGHSFQHMVIFDSAAARALNHLLEREPWACARLAPFTGEVVELRCDPLPPLRLAIAEEGHVRPADPAREPALVITATADILTALSKGEEHVMRSVGVSGNEQLAREILLLLRYLRWDVEEDLSRVFGDVLAHRIAGGARQFAAWQAEAARRFAENVVEYAVEERDLIVSHGEFDAFAEEVARLRDDLARLEQRVERHSRRSDGGHP